MQPATQQAPRSEFWIVYAIFFAFAFACYSPVLSSGYAFSDDFYHLAMFTRMQDCYHELMVCSCLEGRPVLGVVLGLAMGQMHSIADFAYLRFFGICAAAAVALCAYVLMQANGWRRLPAAALSLACIAVPGFQIYTAWSVAATFIVPMLFAFFAVRLTNRLSAIATAKSGIKLLLAATAQFVGIAIYQPAAMFYWFFAAICLLNFDSWNKEKTRTLFTFLFVFGLAAASELVVFEIAKHVVGTNGVLPGRSHLTLDLLAKAKWFVTGPLVDSLNINRLESSPRVALFVGAFLLGGLPLFFRGNILSRAIQLGVAGALLLLCYLPNLAIAESFSTYRTQTAMAALIVLYCGLAFTGYVQTFLRKISNTICSAGLIAFCLVNLIAAHVHVQTLFVTPQILELDLLRAQVHGEYGPDLQKKPLLLTREESFAPYSRYDEFGLPSMAQTWVPEPAYYLLSHEPTAPKSGLAATTSNSVK